MIRASTRFPTAGGDLANASINALPVVTRSEADTTSQDSKDSRGQTASGCSFSSEGGTSADSRRRNPDDRAALSAASAFGLSFIVASEGLATMSRVGVTLSTAGVDCKGDLLNGQSVVPVELALFKLIVTGDFMLDVVLCERQEALVSGLVPGGNVDSLGDQVLDPRLRVNSRNVVCLQKLINLV